MRRLNQAGVPCGVLIGPVIPGLSDRPEQLEAVVTACVEAGATSVMTVALHLRPGVREHFMSWLSRARPDLVSQFERRYPKAYLPQAEQRALSETVGALVAAARRRSGHPPHPGVARRGRAQAPEPADPPSGPAPADQLALGLVARRVRPVARGTSAPGRCQTRA